VGALLSEEALVQCEEMTHIVSHQGPTKERRALENNDIVGSDELGMLSLDGFDIVPAVALLGTNRGIEHLVEEQLQRRCTRFRSLARSMPRRASSWLRAINSSISEP